MANTVFITGAARRIGRGLALRFAARGWNIGLHYGSSEERAEETRREIEALGADVCMVRADVRNREEIRRAFFEARDHFGSIDLLVNNAGVYPAPAPIEDVTEEMWRWVIETNLYGEFFAAQAAAEAMMEQEEGGRIVNISSLGACQIWKNRIPYNVSKAGVIQLTRALARALAPKIAVNSVAPGTIELPDDPAPGKLLPADRIPMKRYGTVDDIFSAVWFLGVDAGYITGQTLIVDGGLNIAQEASQM
ncbi:MAG: short-chain dehydrogenase/reductase [Chlorobi bacterium]|nr:short-chain dehydrogenase/reductase [Chlorobiota bacterium]